MKTFTALTCTLALLTGTACASTSAEWQKLFTTAKQSCAKASGLRSTSIVGQPVDFSGHVLVTVHGTYPQKFMKGQTGTFACLYNKSTKQAEAQEILPAKK